MGSYRTENLSTVTQPLLIPVESLARTPLRQDCDRRLGWLSVEKALRGLFFPIRNAE